MQNIREVINIYGLLTATVNEGFISNMTREVNYY